MPQRFTVWLPYAPTTNHLFAHGFVGGKIRRFPSKVYKAWRQEAVLRMRTHRPQLCRTLEGHLSLHISLTPPDKRKRDASNALKPIEDALVEARIIGDDSQIKRITVTMNDPDANAAGAVVEVSELRLSAAA